MWIVKLALRRPSTVIIVAILLLIIGPLTLCRTPTDIFPNINIPVQAAAVSNDKESQLSILIRIPARHL